MKFGEELGWGWGNKKPICR